MKRLLLIGFALIFGASLFTSCEVEEKETPTHELMQGVWELTEAYNAEDSLVTEQVSPLLVPNIIHLNETNGVISTAAPLFMYIVYGESKFIDAVSKFDQAFNYADEDFGLTLGEWSLKKGEVTDHFAIEMKMKFPTVESVTSILNLMNIEVPSFVETIIYHKFVNVKVEINDDNRDVMWWTFDDQTVPEYNIKDENLNYALWHGVSTDNFTRCALKFERKVKSIEQMVDEAYAK